MLNRCYRHYFEIFPGYDQNLVLCKRKPVIFLVHLCRVGIFTPFVGNFFLGGIYLVMGILSIQRHPTEKSGFWGDYRWPAQSTDPLSSRLPFLIALGTSFISCLLYAN